LETQTVNANKLNLRAGPGENYSILGQIEEGAPIKQVSTSGDWTEIEAPAGAYAFVASSLIRMGQAGEPVDAAPTDDATVPPIASTPTEATPPTVASTPVESTAPPVLEMPADPLHTNVIAEVPTPETAHLESTEHSTTASVPEPAIASESPVAETSAPPFSVPSPMLTEEPPPKRIVQREGIVKGTVSIQAPTHFELVSPFTGETINYLYTTSTNLQLRRYRGLRIVVTGEEGLDKRWPNVPVITIQRIQVVD
jgi:uncharacterized protein YraI